MTDLKVLRLNFTPIDPYEIGYKNIFSKIKRMSVVSTMMETPKKYIGVVEVQWNGRPDISILSDLEFFDRVSEIARDDGSYLYILTGRHHPFYSELYAEMIETYDCFFEYPTVFTKESVCMSIVGSQKNIRGFVDTLKELEMQFKIISKKNYYVKGKGLLTSLTTKQYECLKFAFENGFYDIPKWCQTRELAKKKGISHTTFSLHLRKAEKSLLKALFE
ncbi:MAG: helix-turn-helix domain-containing protein [Candidatus Thermoplasmatota archaeon]